MIGLERESAAAWPHAHGLVVGEGLVKSVPLYGGKPHAKTVPFPEPFWVMWQQRNGGGHFVPIDGRGTRDVSFYCMKYAERGKLYFSTGLERFRGAPPVETVRLYPVRRQAEAVHSTAGEDVLTTRSEECQHEKASKKQHRVERRSTESDLTGAKGTS
jgi:hypothetical protein